MRRILACAGVNGDEKALQNLLKAADSRKPDGIIFAGGITAPNADAAARVDAMTRFFSTIGRSGYNVGLIPGPYDAPLRDFLRAAVNSEVVFPNLFSVHATLVAKGVVVFNGLGGLLTEVEEADAPVIKYSHASVEYFLRTLWRADGNIKFLMLSEPPTGKLAGQGGSGYVRELVKSYHPDFCIVGGEKKYRGMDEIGDTIVVNPGMLAEGSAAWVEWRNRKVEMLDL